MPISIGQILTLMHHVAAPGDHTVTVDGKKVGKCTRAAFRPVLSLKGLEFVLDYAYENGGKTTAFGSRLRREGLGKGGNEQILVNGQAVEDDDVLISAENLGTHPAIAVEFRYSIGGKKHSAKFAAAIAKFKP